MSREQRWSLKSRPVFGSGFETQESQAAMATGRAPENQTFTQTGHVKEPQARDHSRRDAPQEASETRWYPLPSSTRYFLHLLFVCYNFPYKSLSGTSRRTCILITYG